jgi:6-phosphofructokinase 1
MTETNILVADNSESYRKSLVKKVLKGYNVIEAGSPDEAREKVKENLIHLAIIDIRLKDDNDPKDESGLELSKEIDPAVPCIVLTAYPPGWVMADAFPVNVRIAFAERSVELYMVNKADGPEVVLNAVKKTLMEKFELIPKRRIAVLTSGGDSPGMNAAIRGIVRTAMGNDVEVIAIQDGYKGLTNNLMHKLRWNEVSDILGQGGTILRTARYPEFKKQATRDKAVTNIINKHITGLIVIGGDGSMRGAQAIAKDLSKEYKDLHIVAIPGTIDNDLWGTDMSLGAASAVNAMIEEIRNMHWSARALRRIFVCEVMGRYCGYPALGTALGIGADAVLLAEKVVQIRSDSTASQPLKDRIWIQPSVDKFRDYLKEISKTLEEAFARGKGYGFVIVAEGIRLLVENQQLDIEYTKQFLEDNIRDWSITDKPDVRAHVVGYPVRGVPPCRYDLWLGARLGAAAVKCLLDGKTDVMVGWSEDRGEVIETPFDEVLTKSNRLPNEIWADRPRWQEMLDLQEALACPPKLREQLRDGGNPFVG